MDFARLHLSSRMTAVVVSRRWATSEEEIADLRVTNNDRLESDIAHESKPRRSREQTQRVAIVRDPRSSSPVP